MTFSEKVRLRDIYRNTLAHAVITERRIWGSGFDLRRVMVITARVFREQEAS
jgi:hypothetical protein